MKILKRFKNGNPTKKKNFWFYFLNALCWSLIGGLLIVCGLQFADKKTGFKVLRTHTAVVVSESMSRVNEKNLYYLSPDVEHIQVGDIIKAKEYKSFDDVKLLDVVIYNSQDGLLICHRVVDKYVDPIKGECLVTRGDANSSDDTPVRFDIVRGKVTQVTPKLGKVILFMQTPYMLVGLFGTGFFVLLGYFIASYSKEKKNKDSSDISKKNDEKVKKKRISDRKTNVIVMGLLLSTSLVESLVCIGNANALRTKETSSVSFGIGASTPVEVYKTVYFETKSFFNSGAGNESVKAYCWSSTESRNNGWPGEATTWVTDIGTKKIFSFNVNVTLYDKILFTKVVNGNATLKTADISMSSFDSFNTAYLNADDWSGLDYGIPVGFYNR